MKKGLKTRIRQGDTLVGMFVMVPSAAVVEMLGYAGFDYVILDGEHGAADTETLEHQLRAADAAGIPALVRICGQTSAEILRVLDAGACGIVVPHVLNAEQARALVSATRYPPKGRRGIATTTRVGRHGMVTLAEHLETAENELLVIPQIEDAEAVSQVTEIASVDGVDAVFVGPADLSLSMGHPGNPGHPEVVATIDMLAREIRAAGKGTATFCRSEVETRELMQRGYQMMCFSSTLVFSQRLQAIAKELIA